MNANSGKAGSEPPKWKIVSKANALTPSVAAKESTTVAISSTGATTARSSRPSTQNTTASTIGITTLAS